MVTKNVQVPLARNHTERTAEYRYGMRLRGFAPLCQPMNGFKERKDDPTGRYHDIIVYNRRLSPREIRDYELDELDSGD